MDSNTCLVCVGILWSLFISHATGDITISEEELGWEKEFRLMKKPSVKTIKTEYGDIYDCVDFYKQPAFDHPLLKNHTFHPQMRPSFIPKTAKVETSSGENAIKLEDIKLKDGGCPMRTVPIRRISKEEYIQMRRFTKQYAAQRGANGLQPQPGTHLAIAQTKYKPGTIYNGVGSYISIHNPSVTGSQYSSAEFILQSGSDSIQVGWTVNPTLNKDNRTRFFQYLNAGESHCFNNLCPGFVSVRQDLPIDFIFQDISIYGKAAYIMEVFVYQDVKNGNWWLQIGTGGTILGFWPQQIFTGMAHSATYVAVGGEAYSPPGQSLAPMGNGHYPVTDTHLSAYFTGFFVVDENYKQINTQDTEEYRDIKNYAVFDIGFRKTFGRLVFYGGPDP